MNVPAAVRRRLLASVVVGAFVVALGPGGGAAAITEQPEDYYWGATTSRASVSSTGRLANDDARGGQLSAHGRYVAFVSNATNLVTGDTNGSHDVFVRDRLAGVTERVSVGPRDRQANGSSSQHEFPSISADGRYVAFYSTASNLVAGDTNDTVDVFVRDRVAGVTRRVSVGASGRQANRGSQDAAISADGRHVAFESAATNLVAGDTNGEYDIFVRDLVAGATERVSVSTSGRQANWGYTLDLAISADGRYVAFDSYSTNLVRHDTNRAGDIFVRDRLAGTTRRVSVRANGEQSRRDSYWPTMSADGRFVAFGSDARLTPADNNRSQDVYIHDLVARKTSAVSVSPFGRYLSGGSVATSISADGRFVAFDSSSILVPDDDTDGILDVFVRDRLARVTQRVSVGVGDSQADGESFWPEISADGRHVVFTSVATNLVPGEDDDSEHVYVRDRFGDESSQSGR